MAVPVGSRWKVTKALNQEELNEFGNFLFNARTSIGYTSIQMAELLDIHRTSYRRWERGIHVPHADVSMIIEDVKRIVAYVKSKEGRVAV